MSDGLLYLFQPIGDAALTGETHANDSACQYQYQQPGLGIRRSLLETDKDRLFNFIRIAIDFTR